MFVINSNDQSKQCQRFMDVHDEPLTMMAPIRGYDKLPLAPLEQAVKPLIRHIPEIEQMAYIVRMKCEKPPPNNLSEDQSAAIMLYTLEWEPKEESVYYVLNKTLREEDRQILRPWFSYLKLLITALSLLPSSSCTVFRGIKDGNQKHRYKKGEKIIWWGFSSCTSKMDVLSNDAFLGSSGDRIFFTIECQSGKDIRRHSFYKREDEILLPPAREFQVESILSQSGGLCMIHLKETQPKYPLLESFSTISQLVQTFSPSNSDSIKLKTSSEPISYNPILTQPIQTSQDQSYYIQTQDSTEDNGSPSTYNISSSNDHGCCYYLLIACGLVFCCPCTACYLLFKL